MRPLRPFICACLFALLHCTTALAAGPEATISAVQQAIDDRDADAFAQLVDIDRLTRHTVDTFLNSSAAQQADEAARGVKLPPAVESLVLAARNPQMRGPLQTLLTGEARAFLLYGVRSGHFAGTPDASVPANGMLAPYLGSIAPGRKTITPAGPVRKDGADRIVPVTFYDAGSKENTRLELRMAETENGWKVAEIGNLEKLLSTLRAK